MAEEEESMKRYLLEEQKEIARNIEIIPTNDFCLSMDNDLLNMGESSFSTGSASDMYKP